MIVLEHQVFLCDSAMSLIKEVCGSAEYLMQGTVESNQNVQIGVGGCWSKHGSWSGVCKKMGKSNRRELKT